MGKRIDHSKRKLTEEEEETSRKVIAKEADWAKASLAAMVDRRIIGGSNGKLNPTGKVTRAEVAKMLWALENN